MGDESVIEQDIGDGGKQASVKTAIVPEPTGTRVDGNESRDELGDEKEDNRNIEFRSGQVKFMGEDISGEPKCCDNEGREIDKHHFRKLKEFGVVWNPD